MKLFRAVTTFLFGCALTSAALHVVLLMSDSPNYRTWVYVQMALYSIAAWLLWQVRKFDLVALIALALITVPLTYINATYLNYGNDPILWWAPVLFWCIYGFLAHYALEGFRSRSGAHGA